MARLERHTFNQQVYHLPHRMTLAGSRPLDNQLDEVTLRAELRRPSQLREAIAHER